VRLQQFDIPFTVRHIDLPDQFFDRVELRLGSLNARFRACISAYTRASPT
jgi:hypothetical protein